MTYELAKELKEAGYPQREPNSPEPHDRYCGYGLGFCFDDGVYCPSLSELIVACGDGFYSLIYVMRNDWRCFSERDGDYIDIADGKTPEEAVARLYLALHKK